MLFRSGYGQKMENLYSNAIENNDIAIALLVYLTNNYRKKETKGKTHFLNRLLAL